MLVLQEALFTLLVAFSVISRKDGRLQTQNQTSAPVGTAERRTGGVRIIYETLALTNTLFIGELIRNWAAESTAVRFNS